ncbi:MAG TPA: hypothetical protein VFG47_04320 [Geminicoccaceae bacterium]|nr:hypothetical protein [Geminicoccaceae bacterium]
MLRTFFATAGLLTALLVVGACGDDAGDPGATPPPAAAPEATPAQPGTTPPAQQ